MDIKYIKLKKGMSKEEVNELISECITLEDEVYNGNAHKHNWKCKCGNVIEGRMWSTINRKGSMVCECCKYIKQENKYKHEVEKDGEYEYIRSYRKGDVLPNGKIVGDRPYIQIKHKFCESVYEIVASGFINDKKRCGKCCGSYKNSFEYYVEKVLKLRIGDIWDFEKNKVSPITISVKTHTKVFLKCKNVDYHNSYDILPSNFIRAVLKNGTFGCPYCHSKKVHPRDSFAQYHIDNTDKDFLEKYWDYEKNVVDPWGISFKSNKKVWIKCKNEEVNELNGLIKKDYHPSYEISCNDLCVKVKNENSGCPYCRSLKVHVYDSFGYSNPSKAQSWSHNNKISPFGISKSNGKKYNFICYKCGREFTRRISDVTRERRNHTCAECSKSFGEQVISKWLNLNNIEFAPEKEYKGLIGVNGGNLRYDFYLIDFNILIEYDGEFHYENRIGNNLKQQKIHDRLKNEYCKDNDIKLIRIPYWEFDNIEEILNKELVNSNKLI